MSDTTFPTEDQPANLATLAVGKLRLDGDTQPRAEIDDDLVYDYADAYEAGVDLPPLVVFFDGASYWLVDGFHRWHAARKAELDKVPCEVRQGTLEEARWYSYSVNQTHGLRRTNADKRKAVEYALRHPKGAKLSDRQIAEHVGVAHVTVGRIRKEIETDCNNVPVTTRTGRDGRTIDTSNIGKGKKSTRPKSGRRFTGIQSCIDKSLRKDIDKTPIANTKRELDALAILTPLEQQAVVESLVAGRGNTVRQAIKSLPGPFSIPQLKLVVNKTAVNQLPEDILDDVAQVKFLLEQPPHKQKEAARKLKDGKADNVWESLHHYPPDEWMDRYSNVCPKCGGDLDTRARRAHRRAHAK